MLPFDDSDWPAVVWNLQRVERKWGRFYSLLVRAGDETRTSWRCYVTVVQSVLIFIL